MSEPLNTRRTVAQGSQGICPDQSNISRTEEREKGVPNSCIKNYYMDLVQTSSSPVGNIQEVCGVGLGGFKRWEVPLRNWCYELTASGAEGWMWQSWHLPEGTHYRVRTETRGW